MSAYVFECDICYPSCCQAVTATTNHRKKKLQLKLQVERRMLVKNKVSMKVVPLFVPENLSHHINCHSGSNNECTVPEEI